MGWADEEPGESPGPSAMASCALWSLAFVGLVLLVVWLVLGLIRKLT